MSSDDNDATPVGICYRCASQTTNRSAVNGKYLCVGCSATKTTLAEHRVINDLDDAIARNGQPRITMMVPILVNYDHTKAPVGMLRTRSDGVLIATLFDGLTKEQLEDTLGNVGYQIIKQEGDLIKEVAIYCFSVKQS